MGVDTDEKTPLVRNESQLTTTSTVYVRYASRWYMLFLLCLLNVANASVWVTYAPIATVSEIYYDEDITAINWLSECFMAISIPFGFIASWALDAKGLRFAVMFGAWVNAVGAWVRYLSVFEEDRHKQFAIVFVGQSMCALAQSFILSAPTKMAATWFGEKERGTANMIASISNPLGIAVAGIVVPIVVKSPTGDEIPTLLWILAIPSTVALVLALFTLKSKPPSPPSGSAEEESHEFFLGLRTIYKIKPYVQLWFVFGIGVGIFNAVTTLMEQIIQPHGYNPTQAGFLQALLIIAGLGGAAITGPIVDRTKAYLTVLKTAFVLAVLSFVFLTVISLYEYTKLHFILLSLASALVGMLCFSILPVCLELGVETSYPVAEGTSAGMLWVGGQMWGIIFVSAMGAMTDKTTGSMANATYFMCGVAGFALILCLTLFTPYKRLMAERLMDETQPILVTIPEDDLRSDTNNNDDLSSRPIVSPSIQSDM